MDMFILRGREPAPATWLEWAAWFEKADRTVAKTDVGDYRVSTVFLGLNHQFGDGPPLLFESMVFIPGEYGGEDMRRYSTWDEAQAGHDEMVAELVASTGAERA